MATLAYSETPLAYSKITLQESGAWTCLSCLAEAESASFLSLKQATT